MKIIHISAECYPIAKVGGLADVVGALPKYQRQDSKNESIVVLPYIYNKFTQNHELTLDHKATLPFGNHDLEVNILKNNDLEFPVYLVQIEGFSHRHKPYGYSDDDYFYIAFQIATLNWLHQWTEIPDIIHCHDYHTGFVPFMMKYCHQFPKFRNLGNVFTIHNGEYQGVMGNQMVEYFPDFDHEYFPILQWDGNINAMATAVKCAWRVTTVSPQYMNELMHQGRSIDLLFQQESAKSLGILNGIDNKEWNPKTDPNLIENYDIDTVKQGKSVNKEFICNKYNFDPKLPIISFIGRFVYQKGVDVLIDAIYKSISDSNIQANFLIMGNGDDGIESKLWEIKNNLDNRINTYIGYDETFARIVYAGSDFIIMPSRFEPCGLNQFYTLRYGGVPIVRTVGGLLDSILDYEDEEGTGIRFIHLSVEDILHALDRATKLYNTPKLFLNLTKNNMKKGFSWQKSAEKYLNLYRKLM